MKKIKFFRLKRQVHLFGMKGSLYSISLILLAFLYLFPESVVADCKKDCVKLQQKRQLKKGMTLEGCINILCGQEEKLKNWKDTGFDLLEAIDWEAASFSPADAKNWQDADFSSTEAKDWKNAGFDLLEAIDWGKSGLGPSKASVIKKAGIAPKETNKIQLALKKLEEEEERNEQEDRLKYFAELATKNSISDLLKQAGYTKTSLIQIHHATITLVNYFGAPFQEANFYIFSTRDNKPKIQKIKVVVYTHRDDIGINLLTYAPVLSYPDCIKNPKTDCGHTQYLAKEVYNRFIEGKYSGENPFISGLGVPPPLAGGKKAGAYIFNYGAFYMITYRGFYSDSHIDYYCAYEDIYRFILKKPNVQNRSATMCFGARYNGMLGLINKGDTFENGKTFCVDTFKRIYPK